MFILFTGKCEASSQGAENKLDSTVYINVEDDSNDKLFSADPINISQVRALDRNFFIYLFNF